MKYLFDKKVYMSRLALSLIVLFLLLWALILLYCIFDSYQGNFCEFLLPIREQLSKR